MNIQDVLPRDAIPSIDDERGEVQLGEIDIDVLPSSGVIRVDVGEKRRPDCRRGNAGIPPLFG